MPNDEIAGPPPLEPTYSREDGEELRGVAFFLKEIGSLHDRGLIPDDSYQIVLAEYRGRQDAVARRGHAEAAMQAAKRLSARDPKTALIRANQARADDPSRKDAWSLAVELHRRLKEDDAAIAVCTEAVEKFPDFAVRPEQIRADMEARARAESSLDGLLGEARELIRTGQDEAALVTTALILKDHPEHFDALVLRAFAMQRLNRLHEARAAYRRVQAVEPANPTWSQWVREIDNRLAAAPPSGKPATAGKLAPSIAPTHAVTPPVAFEPRVSWGEVAGEFLQDHWQKLILCLAVLLIVVSSNVGAYQVLGGRLWTPVGKCLLALIYTSMFAAFGVGLVRWGAERAGRIMLLTTLIVVPANFMLIGQMKLLTEPSPWSLAVLAVDSAALFLLIQWTARALKLARGAWFLSVALFALSIFNVAAAPNVPWPWAWQYALFLAPALVFLGAMTWLTSRVSAAHAHDQQETAYFGLALLSFAFLTGLIRTGVYALELVPTLYALSVMLTGVSCVIVARSLPLFDPDPRRAQWLKLAGLSLTGLAFALALARPMEPSPLYSGNTLATALIALGLYSTLLVQERLPAYLYLAFGALFLAYFGAFYFARDLMHAVEEAVRKGMGYDRKLPEPFRAINGLVFNPLLAGLSLFFARKWGDRRLAKHCHYIGVPLSIAACAFSGFEPKAAVICLSGYTILYALGAWVFAAPMIVYLSSASGAGAVYFGSVLTPGVTPADRALIAALLAFANWLVVGLLRWRAVDEAYRRPLAHMSEALAVLAMVMAVDTTLSGQPITLAASLALLASALVAVLLNRDELQPRHGYLAVVGGNVGLAFLANWALLSESIHPNGSHQGMIAGLIALAGVSLANILERRRRDGESSAYPVPLFRGGLIQAALALVWAGIFTGSHEDILVTADFALLAALFLFTGLALAGLTRPYPSRALANLALACGLGLWVCGFQVLTRGAMAQFAAYGAVVSLYSLLLIAIEEAATVYAGRPGHERDPVPGLELFARALPWFALGNVALAVALCLSGFTNGPATIFTLASGAVALLWSTRLRPVPIRVHAASVLAVSSAWCFTAFWISWNTPGLTFVWLGFTSAIASIAFWTAWRSCSRRERLALYVAPAAHASELLSWLVFLLAVLGRIGAKEAYPIAVLALFINAFGLILHTAGRRRPVFTYRAIGAVVVAVYLVLFSVGDNDPEKAYILGLVGIILALIGSSLGFILRRAANAVNDRERLYATPLFNAAFLMTMAGALEANRSPWTMALAALSFLLFVKGIPARQWLYASIVSLAWALYQAVMLHWPHDRLVLAVILMAYALWTLGMAVRRFEPSWKQWLQLPHDRYDTPFFNSALLCAIVSAGLRIEETRAGLLPWSSSAGLTLGLAAFMLLMMKPYPTDTWIHASALLASAALGLAAYPAVHSELGWPAIGMGWALGWYAASRVLDRYGDDVRVWTKIPDLDFANALNFWSRLFFTISSGAVAIVVGALVLLTLSGTPTAPESGQYAPWASLLLALALGSIHLLIGSTKDVPRLVMGLSGAAILGVWWLAAPISPMVVRWGIRADHWMPLSTALMAFGGVLAALQLAHQPGWKGGFWRSEEEEDVRARLDAFGLQAGLGLAVLALLLTRGVSNATTVETALIAAGTMSLAALARNGIAAGYAAAMTICVASIYAALELTRAWGITAGGEVMVADALGLLIAVGLLMIGAGWRRRASLGEAQEDVQALPASDVSIAFEQVACLGWMASFLLVVASAFLEAPPGKSAAMLAVGVLFGLTLAVVWLIGRWRFDWLIFPAQTTLIGAYLYYRWAFPIPAMADATVLTLFGYLDLALAEVMQRVGLGRFARPTRTISLILPVLPLAFAFLGIWNGSRYFDELQLFILLAVGTFYGVACYTIQWRSLGYAAAVLYNAFLWLLWGRIGWTLSDRPQFFLIPVGLSTVLFAEVNRRDLGRAAVNAIRGVGLTLAYVSLAVPTWQFQGLGSWTTLLFLALAGIFVGIGLRAQMFLWFGLVMFVLDVVYQLFRFGAESSLAKWAIMLALGVSLVLFVALNEKKKIVLKLQGYYEDILSWE